MASRQLASAALALLPLLGSAARVRHHHAASPPCHRIHGDGLGCLEEDDAEKCNTDFDHFQDGSCSSAGFDYCYTGAFAIESWAKGEGDACEQALGVLKKTGYPNDGCGGKSEPLPCEEATALPNPPSSPKSSHSKDPVTAPCHRVTEDALSCRQEEEEKWCEANSFHFQSGDCNSAGYHFCYTGAYEIESWTRGDGEACAEALRVLNETGYPNDGCKGKSDPLPCRHEKSEALPPPVAVPSVVTPPCHRIEGEGSSCKQEDDQQECSDELYHFQSGACSSAGFGYCYKGAYAIESWTKGEGEACEHALHILKNTGYANNGCDGKSEPLPC